MKPRSLLLVLAALPLAFAIGPSPAAEAQGSDAGAADAGSRLEGAALDPLLGEIAKARKGVRTMKANFTQERRLTLLATSVKSTGEMASDSERLRWELYAPDDVVYFIGPEGLSYRTKTSKSTMPNAGANVSKALGDIRALLGGDLSLLKDRYTLSGTRGAEVEITGVAKDRSANVRGFTIVLDRTLVVPVHAKLLEGKTDAIEIAFSNAQLNVVIDPGTLRP